MPKDLIAPHGGTLINRVVADDQRNAVIARAEKAPFGRRTCGFCHCGPNKSQ